MPSRIPPGRPCPDHPNPFRASYFAIFSFVLLYFADLEASCRLRLPMQPLLGSFLLLMLPLIASSATFLLLMPPLVATSAASNAEFDAADADSAASDADFEPSDAISEASDADSAD